MKITGLVLIVDVTAGIVLGVIAHYYLYRVGLPIVPFIYQAF